MRFAKLFLLALLPSVSAAQTQVPELDLPVQVDGELAEEAWSKALLVELPYEVDPGESTPAPVRTECLLFSTEKALYVAFRAYDPNPQEVRAHLADRDQLFRDDFVGIILDTFADRRRAFQFLANPLGVQADAIRMETAEQQEDFRWDAIWQAAGKLTSFGYQVEMAIPFAALRFPAGSSEKLFGFAALRVWPRSLRRSLLSHPVDRNNPCFLCQFPLFRGLAAARAGRAVEFNPTWVAARAQSREALDEPLLSRPTQNGDAGASLLVGLSPNVSLNLALNPDFSQVEADAKQLSVNRVFTLFFPEKRPFFMESSDLFTTPLQAVYTRTMVDPDWGVKLTGKEGSHAFGLFLVRDQVTPLILPGPESSSRVELEQASTAAVGRYRYDLGNASTLGALITHRQGSGLRSSLGGFDGMLRLSRGDTLTWQWLRSTTTYPGDRALEGQEKRLSGTAWEANFSHATRNFEAWAWARDLSEGFRADMGFIPRVGVRGGEVGAQKVLWGKEGDWFSVLRLGGEVQAWEDSAGRLLERTYRFMGRYQGPLQSTVFLTLSKFRKSWQGQRFDGWSGRMFGNVRFSGDVTASCGIEGGDAIDYAGSRPARRWAISPGFTWNLGRHLYLQGDFTGERLTVPEGELYEALLAELRIVYQFTVRSFLRVITQTGRLRTHPERYPEPTDRESRDWAHQLLFAYKVNPQTLLYLGASDGELGNELHRAVTMHRSVFLKLSVNLLF